MEATFAEIHRTRAWGGSESVSGPGSGVARTASIRRALRELLVELDVRSLLDAPCGDCHWMKEVDLGGIDYVGVDVVREIVAANRRAWGEHPRRRFLHLDLTVDPLPRADVILCRDALVHFSFADIHRAFANLRRSGSRYLLTTSFVRMAANDDIATGSWRAINLERPPFGLPAPLRFIDERGPGYEPAQLDKILGLWRVADVPQ
jgi:hypothetical protein